MITLTTIVYDLNIDAVIAPQSYFSQYKGNKLLIVNNLTDRSKVNGLPCVFVQDHKEEAKKYFKLDIDENTKGYWYTMAYFVAILKIKTKYWLNVSSDCSVNFQDDFISNSIKELTFPQILTTTLPWSDIIDVGKHESVAESANFYYSKGFSDQVFIADIKKLKAIDYNIKDDWDYYGVQKGYVHHGGNSFERRLTTYMKTNNLYRAIYKKYNYKHA